MSHDQALRRRLRDEQRPMTYREAVLCGKRRPHSDVVIAAAKRVLDTPLCGRECHICQGHQISGAEIGDFWGGHHDKSNQSLDRIIRRHGGEVVPRQLRIRAWATRVLSETAELGGA